ncbi:MAG: nuclear transport factor 2 family protein [Steroidobacteraceae bacterium]
MLLALTSNTAVGQSAKVDSKNWFKPSAADVLAVQNLMGYYSLYNVNGQLGELKKIYALKTPGTTWRTPVGANNTEEVIKMIERQAANAEGEHVDQGALHIHSMATPVIVFAGDGKTARGMWDSFGPNINNSKDVGEWLWLKYGIDFIKEDGEWKIWHMQTYREFLTPYDRSWTQYAREQAVKGVNIQSAGTATAPPAGYDGKTKRRPIEVPEPYYTFDPKHSY